MITQDTFIILTLYSDPHHSFFNKLVMSFAPLIILEAFALVETFLLSISGWILSKQIWLLITHYSSLRWSTCLFLWAYIFLDYTTPACLVLFCLFLVPTVVLRWLMSPNILPLFHIYTYMLCIHWTHSTSFLSCSHHTILPTDVIVHSLQFFMFNPPPFAFGQQIVCHFTKEILLFTLVPLHNNFLHILDYSLEEEKILILTNFVMRK